ncbi:class I SAM-dependent methyltransferase [Mycobacterium sp. 852002-40037_SCH5390672]|uniref:class I SAM-dependent methyltransferase n=1 Tax=Mycobacterium sp. 852002-40037_SCH5390672 TaxID=1834089 RepID=UPI00080591B6|nr:class I SAM-dependent methyltransferase [Mycobacterium sp. 852002-40037_SCH5390672]OBB89966.1 hypothetical protein A5782_17165 [Mycobacterium sp. 852002-40037_SCH5390672]
MSSNTDTDWDALYVRDAIVPGLDCLPWDIGEPQPPIMALESAGKITGPVLDAGCGLGATALRLAAMGYSVTAFDISPSAVTKAKREAERIDVKVDFFVGDAMNFSGFDEHFATLIDSSLYHSIPAAGQDAYLSCAHRATRAGGVLHILTFSDAAPFPAETPNRPNCSSREALVARVSQCWKVDKVSPSRITAWMPTGFLEGDVALDSVGRVEIPAWLLSAHKYS